MEEQLQTADRWRSSSFGHSLRLRMRVQRQAFVNLVMAFRFYKSRNVLNSQLEFSRMILNCVVSYIS
jgi:hypothetical protein